MSSPDRSVVGSEQCCEDTPETFCDLEVTNNVWVEGIVDVPAGKRGLCMLDSMTIDQVIYVLEHDPRARTDLLKVTSNADLRRLAGEVPLLPRQDAADLEQSADAKAGLPFYTVFRGQPPNPNDR